MDPEPNWCIVGMGTVGVIQGAVKFWGKLLQTFSDSHCGTLPISGEAQIPELILPSPFFCSFHSPWLLLLSEPLFISISLSIFQTHFHSLFMSLFHHCLFPVLAALLSPKLSHCLLWFSHPLYLRSLPAETLSCLLYSLCLYISPSLSYTFSPFIWPEGERSKCLLEEQGKQSVYTSLLLLPHSQHLLAMKWVTYTYSHTWTCKDEHLHTYTHS